MPDHRRLLVTLQHGTAESDTIRQAGAVARLLGLDMLGIFVEDEAIHSLASFPFARELRLPSHQWHPIDPAHVVTAFQAAAAAAQRRLTNITQTLGVNCGFTVRRGDPAGVVTEILCAGDIIVLSEPRAPSEALTHSFLRAWQTASRSGASLLLLPPGAARQDGPVIALAQASQRALATAAHVARIAHEPLTLLGPETAFPETPPPRPRFRPLTGFTDSALRFALADMRERILVLDRDGLTDEQEAVLLRVAASRGTPVLLVGPPADQAG